MRIPISLIIDDPAPVVSVYHSHAGTDKTADGRPLAETYPNQMLCDFCDIIEKHGICGKFSIVPMPGNKGDIINGLEGVDKKDLDFWLDCVKKRVVPNFSVGPEMLTHNKAINLSDGSVLPLDEQQWAAQRDRKEITPYIAKALSILKEAGFSTCGVTSPWRFGIEVESEYEYSISAAVEEATGSKKAWFFLRGLRDVPNAKPWVAYEGEGRILVSIPATTKDHIWKTIDDPRTDDEFLTSLADRLISEDGKSGEIIRVLETGGYPILVTHWQSLMSNGSGAGLKVLDKVAERINKHLSDTVSWMKFEDIMDMVIADKKAYPKPVFN